MGDDTCPVDMTPSVLGTIHVGGIWPHWSRTQAARRRAGLGHACHLPLLLGLPPPLPPLCHRLPVIVCPISARVQSLPWPSLCEWTVRSAFCRRDPEAWRGVGLSTFPPGAGRPSEEPSLPWQLLHLRSRCALGLRWDGEAMRDRVGTRAFLGVAGKARPGWWPSSFPGLLGRLRTNRAQRRFFRQVGESLPSMLVLVTDRPKDCAAGSEAPMGSSIPRGRMPPCPVGSPPLKRNS